MRSTIGLWAANFAVSKYILDKRFAGSKSEAVKDDRRAAFATRRDGQLMRRRPNPVTRVVYVIKSARPTPSTRPAIVHIWQPQGPSNAVPSLFWGPAPVSLRQSVTTRT